MDTQGSTQTEKEMDLEARYRHKETERQALTQEETGTLVTCTPPEEARQRDSYRKKDKQGCRKTPVHTKTEPAQGVRGSNLSM